MPAHCRSARKEGENERNRRKEKRIGEIGQKENKERRRACALERNRRDRSKSLEKTEGRPQTESKRRLRSKEEPRRHLASHDACCSNEQRVEVLDESLRKQSSAVCAVRLPSFFLCPALLRFVLLHSFHSSSIFSSFLPSVLLPVSSPSWTSCYKKPLIVLLPAPIRWKQHNRV